MNVCKRQKNDDVRKKDYYKVAAACEKKNYIVCHGSFEHYVEAKSLFHALKVFKKNFPHVKDIWKVAECFSVPEWRTIFGEEEAPIC